MIKLYPYSQLGEANYNWLNAHYHFSFANYYNSERIGFGVLKVINDDSIMAKTGFPKHAHDNMEIITYVKSGAITHKDSLGNEGVTKAGDIQVMSAGTGIIHSEYNMENIPTTLYQIWIEPHTRDVTPSWESKEFPKEQISDQLTLLVSGKAGDKDRGALFIHQNAAIYGGVLAADSAIQHHLKSSKAYILISNGDVSINDVAMHKGDGAEIENEAVLQIIASSDAELLIIELE